MESLKNKITEAVARGWCSKENSHKVVDVDLALAIVEEVFPLFCVENEIIKGSSVYKKGVSDFADRLIDIVCKMDFTEYDEWNRPHIPQDVIDTIKDLRIEMEAK